MFQIATAATSRDGLSEEPQPQQLQATVQRWASKPAEAFTSEPASTAAALQGGSAWKGLEALCAAAAASGAETEAVRGHYQRAIQ